MKNKKVLLYILFTVFFIVTPGCRDKNLDDNRLKVIQKANSSSGEYWNYELDTDEIIKESKYSEERFFLNFGSGYSQIWEFEPVKPGEVTISWIAYEGGNNINHDKSYCATYIVDGEKNVLLKAEEK